MRSYAREAAFCKIYAFLMSNEYDGDFSQFEKDKLTEEDLAFADALVRGVVEHHDQMDVIIADYSRDFKVDRIFKTDLAAMEMALYEMRHTDIPHAVAINEAVALAKKYSTEKSVSFVNGILAAYERRHNND